jgi:hypothetical protein
LDEDIKSKLCVADGAAGTAHGSSASERWEYANNGLCQEDALLKEQREAFKREWNITLQDPESQHAGVKIRRKPGDIELSVPKRATFFF